MQARVKQDYRYKSIVALSGQEYVKSEWRSVPADREKEAARHPFLEALESPVEAMPAEIVEDNPVKVSDKKAAKGRR